MRSPWIGCAGRQGAKTLLRSVGIEVLKTTAGGGPGRIRTGLDRVLEDLSWRPEQLADQRARAGAGAQDH